VGIQLTQDYLQIGHDMVWYYVSLHCGTGVVAVLIH